MFGMYGKPIAFGEHKKGRVVDMKCSTCGTDNPANARFCGNCRQTLVEESTESAPEVSGIGVGTAELPMVSFIEAIKLGFNNYGAFNGRATRAEFWWFYLFIFLSGFFFGALDVLFFF